MQWQFLGQISFDPCLAMINLLRLSNKESLIYKNIILNKIFVKLYLR